MEPGERKMDLVLVGIYSINDIYSLLSYGIFKYIVVTTHVYCFSIQHEFMDISEL